MRQDRRLAERITSKTREREFRSLFTFYMWHKQISTKYAQGERERGQRVGGGCGEWRVDRTKGK